MAAAWGASFATAWADSWAVASGALTVAPAVSGSSARPRRRAFLKPVTAQGEIRELRDVCAGGATVAVAASARIAECRDDCSGSAAAVAAANAALAEMRDTMRGHAVDPVLQEQKKYALLMMLAA